MRPDGVIGLRAYAAYLHGQAFVLSLITLLSLVAAGGALTQPLVVREVINGLPAGESVSPMVALLVALVLAVAVINAIRDLLLQRTAERLVLAVRRRLAAHMVRLPIAEFDRRRTGDLLSRVSADSTMVRAVVTSGLFDLAASALMVVAAAVFMVRIDAMLFAIACASATLGMMITGLLAGRLRPLAEQAQARLGEMTAAMERVISGARTIRAARAEAREYKLIDVSAEHAYHAGVRQARLRAVIGPAAAGSAQAGFLMVLGVGGVRVGSGAITIGDLASFVLFLFFLMMPLIQAINAYAQLQVGLGALRRIEDVLAIPAEVDGEPAPEAAGSAPAAGPTLNANPPGGSSTVPAVAFDRVTFGYDERVVLREVSFTVPVGSRTALVGPSGAGKTTVLALIERFYEVGTGSIRIDGRGIGELSTDQLRTRLGYVEQDAPVLAGTLRENLTMTAPAATDEKMLAVLEKVRLADLATRSPFGLDAQVGERGIRLSGGERQRLAIARALLADPPILLLDEPTSNLDARNEAALRRAVDAVANDRTTLVVAHRLSTVVDADQIIVIDGGQVVAVGRHDELTNHSELYRELATNQFLTLGAMPQPMGQ